jgi:hypothetical protein
MGLNALALVNAARQELGFIPDLTTLVGNTGAVQFLGLLIAQGRDLMTERDWTMLQRVTTLQTVEPVITTGDTALASASLTNVVNIVGVDDTCSVSGAGVPVGTRVLSASGTTVVMNAAASATNVGAALTFSKDTFSMPADYRKWINQTQWDRTNNWPMLGPISPQEYQWAASGVVQTGPRERYRQVYMSSGLPGIRLWPPPNGVDAPATLSYMYLSSYWVLSSASPPVPKATITADTDTCVFSDDIMIAGLKSRMWRAQGYDSTAYDQDYARIFSRVLSQDGGAQVLVASRRRYPYLLSPMNVPDGNWPSGGH